MSSSRLLCTLFSPIGQAEQGPGLQGVPKACQLPCLQSSVLHPKPTLRYGCPRLSLSLLSLSPHLHRSAGVLELRSLSLAGAHGRALPPQETLPLWRQGDQGYSTPFYPRSVLPERAGGEQKLPVLQPGGQVLWPGQAGAQTHLGQHREWISLHEGRR